MGGGLCTDFEGGSKARILGRVGGGGARVGGGGGGIVGLGLGDGLGVVGGICRGRGVCQRGLCVRQGRFGLGNGGIPHQFDIGVVIVVAVVGFGPFGLHLGQGVLARGDGGFGGGLGDVRRDGVFGGLGRIVGRRRSGVGGSGRGGGRGGRGLCRGQAGGRSHATGPVGNRLGGVGGDFRRGFGGARISLGAGRILGAGNGLRGEGRLLQRGDALAQRHLGGGVGRGLGRVGRGLGLFGKIARQRSIDVFRRLYCLYRQALRLASLGDGFVGECRGLAGRQGFRVRFVDGRLVRGLLRRLRRFLGCEGGFGRCLDGQILGLILRVLQIGRAARQLGVGFGAGHRLVRLTGRQRRLGRRFLGLLGPSGRRFRGACCCRDGRLRVQIGFGRRQGGRGERRSRRQRGRFGQGRLGIGSIGVVVRFGLLGGNPVGLGQPGLGPRDVSLGRGRLGGRLGGLRRIGGVLQGDGEARVLGRCRDFRRVLGRRFRRRLGRRIGVGAVLVSLGLAQGLIQRAGILRLRVDDVGQIGRRFGDT